MKWPKMFEESEPGSSKEDGSTRDEIKELEKIEEDDDAENDVDDVARKLAFLAEGNEWFVDIRVEDDKKVVLVVNAKAPDSEYFPYEIDGVPIEIQHEG